MDFFEQGAMHPRNIFIAARVPFAMAHKVGILGSGSVGQALGLGFLDRGDAVMIGTRDPAKLAEWQAKVGLHASVGTFEEAARFGEVLVLCTKWTGTEAALRSAGRAHFAGKTVIDVTNPLQFASETSAPTLGVAHPDSAGALVQRWLPGANVVKAFNHVPAHYMAHPKLKEGTPDLFIAGNDAGAKTTVSEIARGWGWTVTDMGGIECASLLEALAMLWIRYGFLHNHWTHAFKLLRE